METKAILKGIRNKNHLVFRRLFESFYGDLVNYAHSYLFHRGSSEDVVQEVFIHLWENSTKLDIRTNIKGYLYAMVRNRCLNALKSLGISDSAQVLDLNSILDSEYHWDDPFGHYQDTVKIQTQHILESLPSKMRTIVKMRFIENYKYKEIADELGVSVNTIKTQLRRAKVKMAQYILVLVALLSIL